MVADFFGETMNNAGSATIRTLLDALPAAIYTTDALGRITYFNSACIALSGRVPELGSDEWCVNWKLYRPDGTPLPHAECPMAVALRERRTIRGEQAIAERPDGSRIWFEPYPTPIFDTSGKLVGGINMLVDITGRRESDQTRAFLAAVVENSDDAIITKDLNGVITSWNRSAERLFGYMADEVIGRPITVIIPPERLGEEPEILSKLRRGERVDHFETVRVCKNGEKVNISLTISPVRDSTGRIVGISKIARDITERKRAEAALRKSVREQQLAQEALKIADQRKNEFLATLAHELRNPLAPIRNSLHILRIGGEDDPGTRRITEMLERQVSHMSRLVDDLLDVARITSGKIELRIEPVEIAAIVRGAVEVSKPLIDAAGVELATTLPSEPVTIEGDTVRLTQVLGNLLNNAAKFTDRGGQIWLTVACEGKQAVISVRDTGIGIEPEMMPRIFNMFAQASHHARHTRGGLGIGLALAKQLIEMHGGQIEGQSEGRGRGSEFIVRLPLAKRQLPAVSPEAALSGSGGASRPSSRILIVDDNSDAASSLGMLLKMLGHEIEIANDGAAALQVMQSFRPTVALLDLGMPGMTGYEVARRAREMPECNGTIFVALTGWGQEEDRRKTREAGFDHHLLKPVNLGALEVLLSEATGSP